MLYLFISDILHVLEFCNRACNVAGYGTGRHVEVIDSSASPLCSESLFMEMADHLAEDGFKDVGYQFVNIDVSSDCTVPPLTPDSVCCTMSASLWSLWLCT